MTTSMTRPAQVGPNLATTRSARRRRLGALVALGLLVLAVAAAVGWTRLHSMGRPAGRSVYEYGPGSGYAPGGSVYDEQVPAAGRSVYGYGPGSGYAPGGSVYDEQVPAAGRSVYGYGPGSGYAPGGSVYDEQVPAAGRAGTP